MNNLTIFATYWNEKDWINASLTQIDALEPKKVVIVDGCFDPKIENRSTDGTRETISEWVADRSHATLVSALRMSRWQNLIFLFWHDATWWNWPLRVLLTIYYSRTNVYRLNQASTFTKLLRDSELQPNEWFMTYDADQFYLDETISAIKQKVNEETDAQLLTATERTFFKNFHEMTTEYESRDYNNMPHRWQRHLMILPTRDITLEAYPKPRVCGKDTHRSAISVGVYNHYKFRPYDTDRVNASYQVGDRRKPTTDTYTTSPYIEAHPSVISKFFGKETTRT